MGKVKDARVKTVAKLIKNNELRTFQDIFGPEVCFPRTVLRDYLGTNHIRMRQLVLYPGNLTVYEINRIADYFEVSYEDMLMLINRQVFPFVKFRGDK